MKIKFALLFAFTLIGTANAEEVSTPDGFDLSGLYAKFKNGVKESSVNQVMTDEFNQAIGSNTPPRKTFAFAKKGNPKACNLVGVLFDMGKGVKQDSSKAAIWFKHCEKANMMAAYNLGTLYAEGRGVEKSMTLAAPLLAKSWPELQKGETATRLAYWYRSKNEYQNEWIWASRLKNAKGFEKHYGFLVGEMIANGKAPTNDMIAAEEALNQAMEFGSSKAAYLLSDLYGTDRINKGKLFACISEKIGNYIENNASQTKWYSQLDEEQRNECSMKAKKYAGIKPNKIDFSKLIY